MMNQEDLEMFELLRIEELFSEALNEYGIGHDFESSIYGGDLLMTIVPYRDDDEEGGGWPNDEIMIRVEVHEDGSRTLVIQNVMMVDVWKGLGMPFQMAVMRFMKNARIRIAKCEAARSDRHDAGYYVWPRFGWKTDPKCWGFEEEYLISKIAPEGFRPEDFMKSEVGRAIWKKHGFSFDAIFDLERDQEDFLRYAREKISS